jgi:hypothetical protein
MEEKQSLSIILYCRNQNIDPVARKSIRSLTGTIGIPQSTIGRIKQEKKLKVYTTSMEPKVNDDHQLAVSLHLQV